MDPVALRLTGGHKGYPRGRGRHTVFTGVDLEVREREVLALLGPSGCGKSTLLRTLAGLEALDRGRLQVARPGSVGIAFQDPSLLPWLTVAQNVALGLRFAANRAAREAASVSRTLDELGLAGVADAYPAELSGGQAQRANVARLVVAGRPVLLLDEPFAALDPGTRSSLQDWLLELRRARKLTLVVVTHDLSEALHLGDRVAVMSGVPAGIRRTWDVRGIASRGAGAASELLRSEILRHYDMGSVPLDAAVAERPALQAAARGA
jgi:sulfate transport system ATP-binding protein/sulfonate transport system ATP-binding protein